jgi:hypothetical protein
MLGKAFFHAPSTRLWLLQNWRASWLGVVSLQLRDSAGLSLRVTGFAFGPAHPGVQAPDWLTKVILSFLTIFVNTWLTHLAIFYFLPSSNSCEFSTSPVESSFSSNRFNNLSASSYFFRALERWFPRTSNSSLKRFSSPFKRSR